MRRNIPMLKDIDPQAHERMNKIKRGVCPSCGGELIKDLIEVGRHKGHGKIYCSVCNKVHVVI